MPSFWSCLKRNQHVHVQVLGHRKGWRRGVAVTQGRALEAVHFPFVLSRRSELGQMQSRLGNVAFILCGPEPRHKVNNPITLWKGENSDPPNERKDDSYFHSSKKQPNARASNTFHICDAEQVFLLESDSDPFLSQHLMLFPWGLTFYDCTQCLLQVLYRILITLQSYEGCIYGAQASKTHTSLRTQWESC